MALAEQRLALAFNRGAHAIAGHGTFRSAAMRAAMQAWCIGPRGAVCG
jgi:hypothetical protein